MAYWNGNRRSEAFIYRRVKWPSWEEAEDYGQITGGNVELSAFSDLKAVGTLEFQGGEIPDDTDMVRIYYRFADDFGESETAPMATLFFSVADPVHVGSAVGGSMDCASTLQVLSRKKYGMPFTVAAGTQAVQLAVELAESLGLRVNNPDASAYAVKSDYTFKSEDSYLTIVNWLLGAAGFAACWPDAYGTIQMCRYVEPLERPVSMAFSDGRESIMYPEVKRRSDYQSTPNVVRLSYETDDEVLWAASTNIDPESRSSVVARRQENTCQETVSELAGDTAEERLANLEAMSARKLVDKSSDIEYVDMTHAWVPLAPNDAVGIDYEAAGMSWKGAATNLSVDLVAEVPCRLSARRFVRTDIKVKTEGGILWQSK